MFTRIVLCMTLAVLLIAPTSASAKGGFDFLTITGPDLKEALQVSDTSLTQGFFNFANFYEDQTKAPADPGKGYEITRHYVQGQSDVIFDRLHYYPETGFVFYDGIENGDSEYDGKWYTANPDIRFVFEAALAANAGTAMEKKQPVSSAPHIQTANTPIPFLLLLMLAAGLILLFAMAFRRHKAPTQS
jgi:hypothetical protein